MPYPEGGITLRAVDITERKRAEAALRESEAKFRDLFDGAPVAHHELDMDGLVLGLTTQAVAEVLEAASLRQSPQSPPN